VGQGAGGSAAGTAGAQAPNMMAAAIRNSENLEEGIKFSLNLSPGQ
jgi:outer membrane lipoprotein SlyB